MLEKLFKLKEHDTTVKREILAGATTFLTMAYILAVNPNILGTVMNANGVFVATAIASAIATFIMAFLANYPIGLSAGLGLNAYFAYTVCLGELAGETDPFRIALTAVFVEGIIFIVLSFFKFREQIINSILVNPINALASTNYLGILFWAVIIGLLMKPFASQSVVDLSRDVTDMLLKVISIFIQFAPLGVLGLIYEALSNNGPDLFVDYGTLILIIVVSMLIVLFITNPLIVAIVGRRNPYPLLLKCIRGSAITAFFTRSSAANVPVNLALCEEMGLDREFYSTSIPLGSAINMCGAAITISILALTAAYSVGISVPIEEAIVLCIISTLCACGSSGVAGGSILLVPMACAILGVSDGVATYMIGVGFIIGVIQDSLETALNSSSDVLFTATVDANEKKKAAKKKEPAAE